MSRLSDAQSRGLSHHESALGSPVFIWLTQTYQCTPSTLKRGTIVSVGGIEAEISLTLFVRQAVLSGAVSLPASGKIVMHAAQTYRVLAFGTTAGGATYEIDLGNPHK